MPASRHLHRRQFCSAAAVLAGTVLGVPCAQAARDRNEPPLPALGGPLALTAVPLLDGSTFRPEQAQGQLLVVYWWASWCPFCSEQSPAVESLWRGGRARGLQVLALSIDQRRDDAAAYLQKKGYTFPAGMLTPAVAKVLPKPQGLPVTVARARDGKVVLAEGGQVFPEDIEGLTRYL